MYSASVCIQLLLFWQVVYPTQVSCTTTLKYGSKGTALRVAVTRESPCARRSYAQGAARNRATSQASVAPSVMEVSLPKNAQVNQIKTCILLFFLHMQ